MQTSAMKNKMLSYDYKASGLSNECHSNLSVNLYAKMISKAFISIINLSTIYEVIQSLSPLK